MSCDLCDTAGRCTFACDENDRRLSESIAEVNRLTPLERELVEIVREARDSRAPDYAEAAYPGWCDRADAVLAKAEEKEKGNG